MRVNPPEQSPTFSIHTLGCRANQSDSERLAEILIGAGFNEVPFGQKATCQIVNSCTVTREADRKSAQMVRRAERLGGTVVATGCGVATRGGLKGGGSVLRLPPDQRDNILQLLGVEQCPSSIALEGLINKQKRTRALLRVQDGCDQFCTFCIVPYVRGRSRSYELDTVVEQAQQLAAQGFQEIVLTGIHLSAWGQDFEGHLRLNHLLESLIEHVPHVAFRLGSVEPDLFPVEIFELMQRYPNRLCPHLHLVIQHASDAILERMHRGYSLSHYRDLVDQFLASVPLACLTTDVMVGFPGETDTDFEILIQYLRSTPYYHMHIFPYSIRPGTAASKFSDQVGPEIKNARRDLLLKLAEKKRREVLRGLVGQRVSVLVEETSTSPARGWVQGRAHNFVAVKLRGGPAMVGTRVEVEIMRFSGEFCMGVLV
jgi:threonylcarbamoyladenosine tRNA methylthiotransferase MtaB